LRNGQRPSRKQLALSTGWGKLLADFVWDSRVEGGIDTSPIIVHFRDRDEYSEQRFRLIFDPNTHLLSVIDEFPDYVIQKTLDTPGTSPLD
jgi:hypothetical protein